MDRSFNSHLKLWQTPPPPHPPKSYIRSLFKVTTAALPLQSFALTINHRNATAIRPFPHKPTIYRIYLLKLFRPHVGEGRQATCPWAKVAATWKQLPFCPGGCKINCSVCRLNKVCIALQQLSAVFRNFYGDVQISLRKQNLSGLFAAQPWPECDRQRTAQSSYPCKTHFVHGTKWCPTHGILPFSHAKKQSIPMVWKSSELFK